MQQTVSPAKCSRHFTTAGTVVTIFRNPAKCLAMIIDMLAVFIYELQRGVLQIHSTSVELSS